MRAGHLHGVRAHGGWDGGGVGHGLATALGFSIGRARWIAPPALLLIGAVLLLRAAFPELRPLRAGALCLFAAVVLALADGTLGISPGPAQAVTEGAVHAGPHAHAGGASQWSPAYMEARGGIAGQALWWVTHGLVQGVGVEILVAFLLLAALSLLTGASLVTMARGAGSLLVVLAHAPVRLAEALRERNPHNAHASAAASETAHSHGEPFGEPETAGALAELATPPETAQASLYDRGGEEDGDSEDRDGVWAAEPEEQEAPPREPRKKRVAQTTSEEELTPQGRLRDVVTDDPEFAWKVPQATSMLTRSNGAASGRARRGGAPGGRRPAGAGCGGTARGPRSLRCRREGHRHGHRSPHHAL